MGSEKGRAGLLAGLVVLPLLSGCGDGPRPASKAVLPGSDSEFVSIRPGVPPEAILPAVDEGLRTEEKGPDYVRFVVIRAADRHPPEVKDGEFHVLVGAGVRLPAGSMRIRRRWIASGWIDGNNEELQTLGISVAVERGAPRPFPAGVLEAVAAFAVALASRVPLHPDCVVAMEEVPYTRNHDADGAERQAAAYAREHLRPPPPDGRIEITTKEGTISVEVEIRDTNPSIRTGMMMRRGFDGENRGMLFVYRARAYRDFHMRNCFIPIALAYIRDGRIVQIHAMKPEAGTKRSEIPWYSSYAAVRYALEMPEGWFERHGVRVGDRVALPD